MSSNLHIPFTVMYNWPSGKASIQLEMTNIPNSFLVRVFAEMKNNPGSYYTLSGIANKDLSYNQIVQFLREATSKGEYLTGDIFYIELRDNEGRVVGGGKLDANSSWPPNGSGSSVVFTSYDIKI